MALQRQIRHVGDTEVAIAAQLMRDGLPLDLTGLTVVFVMYEHDTGTVKVAETSATITDATNGKVQYDPEAADVDTAKVYNAYFVASDGSNRDTFPAARGELLIDIRGN